RLDAARHHLGAAMAGLSVAYDLGDGHPIVGRRMPDVGLVVDGASTRVFELLRPARPVLLNLGAPGALAGVQTPATREMPGATGATDRITIVDATATGPIEVPDLGVVSTPAAVLIRPDGHVAWAGGPDDPGLSETLVRWFGRG
ncbi:MAG: hypothetical protein GX868_13030, partial [Actinobacteria bacterium]|nr:hypothetical protein [Actinomycetota bacterium]